MLRFQLSYCQIIGVELSLAPKLLPFPVNDSHLVVLDLRRYVRPEVYEVRNAHRCRMQFQYTAISTWVGIIANHQSQIFEG